MTRSTPQELAQARALEQRAWEQLRAGHRQQAVQLCEQLNREFPAYTSGWYTSSQVALRLNNALAGLRAVERALALEPEHVASRLQQANCLMRLGRDDEARPLVTALDGQPLDSAYQHTTLALLLSRLDQQERALVHYQQAIRREPGVAGHYYNLATVQRFLGRTGDAETALDRALALDPADAEAHKLRADLRRQTAEHNHVPELRAALAACSSDQRRQVTLHFALAKELEDLGEWRAAFESLQRGASIRRALMRYRVQDDVDTMAAIAAAYTAGDPPAPVPDGDNDQAIFVVGLPRTGTTLVERILGMHPQVQAAGELNAFALAMSRAVAALPEAGPGLDKRQRVALSTRLDFNLLGEAYLDSVPPGPRAAPRFIDKMPLNFLYLGLIHRALPRARIIHLQRHPMDACFAIYKTLFADAYPFSYDLDDLASYYLAYHRLMAHWEAVMPGVIHHVSYESLVTDIEPACRDLLAHCQLPWDPDCLAFHRSREASTTASASQVREPVHRRSVGRWQAFATELAPLAERLRAGGVAIDPPCGPASES